MSDDDSILFFFPPEEVDSLKCSNMLQYEAHIKCVQLVIKFCTLYFLYIFFYILLVRLTVTLKGVKVRLEIRFILEINKKQAMDDFRDYFGG